MKDDVYNFDELDELDMDWTGWDYTDDLPPHPPVDQYQYW